MGILSNIKQKGMNALMRADVKLAPHKNDIMFYGGLALLGFGIFKLCQASTKLPARADQLQNELNHIAKKTDPNGFFPEGEAPITPQQATAMSRRAKGEAAWSIFRDYAPGALLTVVGTAAICKSRFDLKDSYLKASAALISTQEVLAQYRERVRAEEGAAMDTHYMYGTKRAYTPDVIGVDENGNPITANTPVDNVLTDIPKDLSIIEIPCTNIYWKNDPGAMLTHFRLRFAEAQRLLDLRGSVTRNDICDLLAVGRDYSDEGMRVGYMWDKAWIDAHNGDSPIKYTVHFVTKENFTKYIPNGQSFEKAIIIELQNLQDLKTVNRFRRRAA